MKPFTLHIPDAAIADLRERLARTRWPDEPPLPPWSTGASLAYMRDIAEYWRTGFDWRPWEAKLNSFRQFTLPIGGIDLHFIHEPVAQGRGAAAAASRMAGRGRCSSFTRSSRCSPSTSR